MKNLFLIILLFGALSAVKSQEDWRLYPGAANINSKTKPVPEPVGTPSGENGPSVVMSPKLEEFISFVDSVEKAGYVVKGYRIQVYAASGSMSKKNAILAQEGFLKLYSNTPSYTLWEYPNWVVRVGDFRTRLEALQFHLEMREMFPASFITRDKINPQGY